MKKLIILVLTILFYSALHAQETGSYINFNVGGGFHNLSYNLQNGSEKGQFGYTINAGYSFFFTPQWGLHTGLGFQKFNSLSTLNYLSSTPDIDSDGAQYLFKANYLDLKEKQQALFVDIPLTIQFKLPVTNKFGLLTSVGGMMSLPVSTTFKTTGGELVTTGYYSQWNAELSNMPQHGFSTYTNKFTGDFALKTSYMAIVDLGGLYKLTDKLDLYVGGYFNYGLNNVLKADHKLVYQPGLPNGIFNGILASNLTNNVVPISIGLKVGLYLHLGENKSPLDFVKPIKTLDPVKPIEQVKPIDPIKSTEQGAEIQPIDSVKVVQPAEPVKAIHPVLEAAVIDTPKKVETPKEVISELPAKPVVQVLTIQNDNAYEQAKMIAESMNLMFGFNSIRVINAKNDKINQLSQILKANSFIHIRFVGHTCNIGSHEINLQFGMKRAINVKQKFIDLGVSKAQLIGESKAYDQPLVPNNSKINRAKNRRVVISVFK